LIDYLHDLPGRLRVRSRLFRNNADLGAAVRSQLGAADGVRSVSVNPVTGSVLVFYDPARASVETLLETMNRHGCSMPSIPLATRSRWRATRLPTTRRAPARHVPAISRAVAGFLVEKAIERSLTAVVAAVF
jgi:copper chaperone CopZ